MVKIENKELSIGDLEKGDYISEEVWRIVTGFDPVENVDVYRRAILQMRGRIWRERKLESRFEGFALRILKDAESVFYQKRKENQGKRKIQGAYDHANEIDENQLDEPTRARHRQEQMNRSRRLTALEREDKQISQEQWQQKAPSEMPPPNIKIISLKGDSENGTQTTSSETDRGNVVDTSQRPDGEPDEPVRQRVEEADRQAQ